VTKPRHAATRRPATRRPSTRWRRLRPHVPRSRWGRVALFGPLAALLVVTVAVVILVARTKVPLPETLPQAQTTLVSYADGSPLGSLQGEQNRIVIPLTQVPVHVRDAVLAAEDRNYYHEPGISIPGIVRAAVSDLLSGRLGAGGSTITQQYVKNAYLTSRRTFTRKVREAIIAVKIDRRYSKDRVLEFYLNTIYFGRGAYGIEAAAETYFGIPAAQLDVPQGAMLAASIQAPEYLDPSVNPGPAMTRWHYVISGMVKDGSLPAGQASGIADPAVRPRGAGGVGGRGRLAGETGYLIDMVRIELEARHFTTQQIYAGGLRVRTTIRPKAQAAAVKAVEGVLARPDDPQAALVAVEPGTGRIVAAYGGRDFAVRPFNNATQALRQPGSSFKPYVLAAALSKGISLKSRFNGSSPQRFPGYDKPVSNFGNEQFGNIDLLTATANSVNTVFVPLAQQAGVPNVIGAARAAGIPATDPGNGLQSKVTLQENASLALGTSEVHPIDQAGAYATFAATGKVTTPFLVDSVTDPSGTRLYQAKVGGRQVMDTKVVADLTFALEHVISGGTATPEAVLAGGRQAAGKTGTTSDGKDAWFVGYAPSLAAAAWMGYDPKSPKDKATLTAVEGVGVVTGGTLPARIWKRFMDAALAGTPNQVFAPPAFVGQTVTSSTTSASTSTSGVSSPPTSLPGPPSTTGPGPGPSTTPPPATTTTPPPPTTTTPSTSPPTSAAPGNVGLPAAPPFPHPPQTS
jgi:membrane peptidoglycan carboxypeptidase